MPLFAYDILVGTWVNLSNDLQAIQFLPIILSTYIIWLWYIFQTRYTCKLAAPWIKMNVKNRYHNLWVFC